MAASISEVIIIRSTCFVTKPQVSAPSRRSWPAAEPIFRSTEDPRISIFFESSFGNRWDSRLSLDAFDDGVGAGQAYPLSQVDLVELDAIGWDLAVPEPSTWALAGISRNVFNCSRDDAKSGTPTLTVPAADEGQRHSVDPHAVNKRPPSRRTAAGLICDGAWRRGWIGVRVVLVVAWHSYWGPAMRTG